LSESDLEFFCDLMAAHTMVDGLLLSQTLDEHFVGNYDGMAQWLVAALKHNFAGFLVDGGGTNPLAALQASMPQTPPQ
jgi:hypothetical protein